MTLIQKKVDSSNLDWVIILLLVFGNTFGVFSMIINHVFLYFILPAVFLYCFLKSINTIKNRYIKLFLILIIWSIISALIKSEDYNLSIKVLSYLLLTVIFCYSIIALSNNEKNIKWFYLLFLFFYLINWYYAIFNFGLLEVDITSQISREQSLVFEKINANRWGYFTLFLTFVAFIYGEIAKSQNWRKKFRVVFILFILVVFFNAIFAGARQVLLLNLPLYFILLYYRYKTKILEPRILLGIGLFVLLVILFGGLLQTFYESSTVNQRFVKSNYIEDARYLLLATAFNYGIENPILGIGPGNVEYRTLSFSHSSYTEIFAETGIVGLFLYLLILFGILKDQIKRYKRTKDKVFFYFSIYIVFYILNNFFYVFYTWFLLMGILYLISAHSDFYYKKYYSSITV